MFAVFGAIEAIHRWALGKTLVVVNRRFPSVFFIILLVAIDLFLISMNVLHTDFIRFVVMSLISLGHCSLCEHGVRVGMLFHRYQKISHWNFSTKVISEEISMAEIQFWRVDDKPGKESPIVISDYPEDHKQLIAEVLTSKIGPEKLVG
ncbi:hypothetical protein SH668x_001859 [Planctomicrobium sp. SH668]|uniref:hypothetical protein n=1 Tax=Planctomicrobium sp. SH668 TaxID=3448126 RepID=UPI003F5BC242